MRGTNRAATALACALAGLAVAGMTACSSSGAPPIDLGSTPSNSSSSSPPTVPSSTSSNDSSSGSSSSTTPISPTSSSDAANYGPGDTKKFCYQDLTVITRKLDQAANKPVKYRLQLEIQLYTALLPVAPRPIRWAVQTDIDSAKASLVNGPQPKNVGKAGVALVRFVQANCA